MTPADPVWGFDQHRREVWRNSFPKRSGLDYDTRAKVPVANTLLPDPDWRRVPYSVW